MTYGSHWLIRAAPGAVRPSAGGFRVSWRELRDVSRVASGRQRAGGTGGPQPDVAASCLVLRYCVHSIAVAVAGYVALGAAGAEVDYAADQGAVGDGCESWQAGLVVVAAAAAVGQP